jgi:hypothetical protein
MERANHGVRGGLAFRVSGACVRSNRWLDFNSDDSSRGGTVKRFSHTRQQRPKVVDVIRPRNHYNNRNGKPNRILLILDSLVYGEKNIKFLSGTLEQRSIFDP